MPTRKLTEEERTARRVELTDHVLSLADCRERKSVLDAELNKEIRHHTERMNQIANELQAGEIEINPQGSLL